ncbi:EexN family lipoprotein [Agrobacterium tumefaciens]|uniref:EexN family lipoprotein n=1 Tax=Agrobacterium tumefaciens TaxID=358 RepID=UPI001572625A|nr:EexN family lipoprotein [Agrobacterium tumefaciens]NTD91807.1 EexN family lipoprotein [Agrobacterium tumefaciens]NTD98381.1 EexN family lipoprotein [Agrobacterium tumefaciens]NTE16169.1 EexN family lipoprotein [Agrobacterium tumefaciens]NTE21335.1 EexN family lipoprotein [Agrobacterium tumefaciens]
MRRPIIVFSLVLLAACSQEAERTHTVDELVADTELLSRTITACRTNPGELRQTPNCLNAEAAEVKLRLQNMRKALGG